MSEVQTVKYGDLVELTKESVDRDKNPYKRYVEGGHMDSSSLKLNRWGFFGEDYVGPAFHRVFKKGQILYGSRRTYLKKVAVAEFDGITANTTFVISPRHDSVLHPDLIPYLMLSEKFTNHSVLNSKGSTNPYINWSDIARFTFELPDKSKQLQILSILRTAESAVSKTEESLKACEKLQQAILLEIFSKRPDWVNVRLGNICTVKGGRQRAPKYDQGVNPVKYLRPANIKKGRFRQEDVKEMDFSEDELKEYMLSQGDILLVEGGEAEDVGDPLYWNAQLEGNIAFQNTLIRLRAKKSKIAPKTLYWLMAYLHRTGFFHAVAAGTKIKHIGSKNTSNLIVSLPQEVEGLEPGVELLETLNDEISHLEQKVRESKDIYQKLIDISLG